MIVRSWGGKVPLIHAEGFYRHLLATGVEDCLREPGCLQAQVLRRDAEGWAHFVLLTIWRDLNSVRNFAPTLDDAVPYPDDDRFDLIPDHHVQHFDLLSLEPGTESGRMSRDAMNSSVLSPPAGPFSHAVRAGNILFLSGQIGQDPVSGQLVKGVESQVHQIMLNIRALLEELGSSIASVQKVNVFLGSMDDFATMNAVYREHFQAPFPARTTVAVQALPMGAAVEIEVVASCS